MGQLSLSALKNTNRTFDNILDSKFNHVSDNVVGTSTTHNNSTDAADAGTLTIPAGRLNVGTVIKVMSFGTLTSTNGSDELTAILNLTHGATTVALASGAALDVADNDVVQADSEIHILSATTFAAISKIHTDAAGGTIVRNYVASTAIDTTVDLVITMNVDWSAANAADQYTHLVHTAQIFG